MNVHYADSEIEVFCDINTINGIDVPDVDSLDIQLKVPFFNSWKHMRLEDLSKLEIARIVRVLSDKYHEQQESGGAA